MNFLTINTDKMKSVSKFSWLMVLVFASAIINPVNSQDIKKELDEFAKKFETAYNKKDDKALKMMYTDNAVRTDPDGTVTSGNDNILMKLMESWPTAKLTLAIKQDKVEPQSDGTVITKGTYIVIGTTNAGEMINVGGTYTNTTVKDNGTWKISKNVLSNL